MIKKICLILLFIPLGLSACSGTKQTLGLTKKSPDEFQVVKRAPLAMPPDYSLRPPQPGAPRPQEQATVDAARAAVFGESAAAATSPAPAGNAAQALLQQAGAANADPNIRRVVDNEAQQSDGPSKKPVIKRIMNMGGEEEPSASVVDPAKEAQRIKDNAQAGRPVTAGQTPSKEE